LLWTDLFFLPMCPGQTPLHPLSSTKSHLPHPHFLHRYGVESAKWRPVELSQSTKSLKSVSGSVVWSPTLHSMMPTGGSFYLFIKLKVDCKTSFFNLLYPHHKMWGEVYWIRFVASVGPSVGPSVGRYFSNSCPLYNSFTNGRISFKLEWHIYLN